MQCELRVTSLATATIIAITNLSGTTSMSLLQELPHKKSGKPNTSKSQAHTRNSAISLGFLHTTSDTSEMIIATHFQ